MLVNLLIYLILNLLHIKIVSYIQMENNVLCLGTPISGHVDNIPRLQEICKSNGLWLHLRGHSLAALTIPQFSNVVS